MKAIIMILSMIGMTSMPVKNDFTKSEIKFIKNVTRNHWSERPVDISRLESGRICVAYPTTAFILGVDGFIYQVWVQENGIWINIGPEY